MAASSSLGTLTCDLIAKTGGFDGPIGQSERLTKKAMKAMGMAVDEFGNYTDRAMKKAAEAMKLIESEFEKTSADIQRQISLYGDVSKAAELRYELEKGALRDLSSLQKESLNDASRRLSAMESANAAFREQAKAVERLDSTHRSMSDSLEREINLYGTVSRVAALRYDTELGSLRNLTEEQKQNLMMLTSTVEAMDNAARAAEENKNRLAALESQHSTLAAAMQQEIDLFENTSRAATVRYELENSALRELSSAKKMALVDQAATLDMMEEESRQNKLKAEETAQLVVAHDNLQESMLQELATYGDLTRVAKLRYQMEKGELKGLTDDQKQANIMLAQQLDTLDQQAGRAGGGMRNLRGQAQNVGWQMQDIAVQMQMGTDAMVIFSQQGSQLASGFGPTGALIGAFIAVAGAVAGVLLKSFMDTKDAMKEMSDRAKELAGDLRRLSEEDRKVVQQATGYSIKDKQKEYDDLTKSIDDQIKKIEELKKSQSTSGYSQLGLTMGGSGGFRERNSIDNTKALADATKALEANKLKLVDVEQQLDDLRDPFKFAKVLEDLDDEIELIGKKGEELHKLVAAQKGYLDGQALEYVARMLLKEALEEEAEAQEKADKEREKAAEKAIEDERKRLESVEKIVSGLEKEAAMFGITSKAAEVEYDILNGIIDVVGGLEGAEAKRLITAAAIVDEREKEKKLASDLEEILDRLDPGSAALKKYENEIKVLQDALGNGLDLAQFDEMMTKLDNEFIDSLLIDVDAIGKGIDDVEDKYTAMWERVSESGADFFKGIMDGNLDVFDGILDAFKTLLAEMANEALLQPIMLKIQESFSGDEGKGSDGEGAASAIGAGGIWAAIAVAVVAGVNEHNKNQASQYDHLAAEIRQASQSTGTILGEANSKSDSISDLLTSMDAKYKDVLNVNYSINRTLEDIREGLTGVAAGFARSLAFNPAMQITTGTSAYVDSGKVSGESAARNWIDSVGMRDPITKFVTNFLGGLGDKVTKEIFKKKVSVLDSGIQLMGGALADILEAGIVEAFTYADVRTTKKTFGVTTSDKVKTQREELDDLFQSQLSDVFENAADALRISSGTYGLDFDDFINRLVVDPVKLSLKDLEGEEITAEIERFLSSTMDGWAEVILGGSDILLQFQKVGEGAFQTMVRLSTETEYFVQQLGFVGLELGTTGIEAVKLVQGLAGLVGGIENLSSSLSSYYDNFFTDAEKLENLTSQLDNATKGMLDTLPQTTREFRDIVEALDLTNEADQKVFATLMSLTPALYEYITAMEAQTEELEAQAAALDDFMQAFRDRVETAFMDEYTRSVWELNRALEESIAAAKELGASEADLAIVRKASALDMLDIQRTQTDAALATLRKSVDAAIAEQTEKFNGQVAAINAEFDSRAAAMDSAMKIQAAAIGRTVDALKASVDKLKELSEALGSAMDTLLVKSPELDRQRWFMSADRLSGLADNFRATGALPDASVIQQITQGLSNGSQNFRTFEEYSLASGRLVNDLLEMKNATDKQLTIEERMLAAAESALANSQANHSSMMSSIQADREARLRELEAEHNDQIRALEAQYELAENQINAIREVNTSVLTVEEAVLLMKDAIAAELGALRSADQIKYEQMVSALEAIAVTNSDMRTFMRNQEFEERIAI